MFLILSIFESIYKILYIMKNFRKKHEFILEIGNFSVYLHRKTTKKIIRYEKKGFVEQFFEHFEEEFC